MLYTARRRLIAAASPNFTRGAALSPVALTFQMKGIGSVTGSDATFGTLTIGASPSANRRVTILIASGDFNASGGSSIVSAVFTPNAGSPVSADTQIVLGRTTTEGMLLLSAVLPVGTTTTLDLTVSNALFSSPRFGMYTVDNSTLSNPTSPVTNYVNGSSGTSLTCGVTTLSGGGLLALFSGDADAGSYTSGITSGDDAFGFYQWGHLNNTSAGSPFNVTVSWPASTNGNTGLGLIAYR